MIKKLINYFMLLLTSGILFHRSTVIGILCGIWVYFGAEDEESMFGRMLTPDLFLFMGAFLIFYRFQFKKILTETGDLDLTSMFICFAGDMAWAVIAMFCTVPTTETGRTAGRTPPKSTSEQSNSSLNEIPSPGVLMIPLTSRSIIHLAMTRPVL